MKMFEADEVSADLDARLEAAGMDPSDPKVRKNKDGGERLFRRAHRGSADQSAGRAQDFRQRNTIAAAGRGRNLQTEAGRPSGRPSLFERAFSLPVKNTQISLQRSVFPRPAGTRRRSGRFLAARQAPEEENMKLIVTAIAATALLFGSAGTGIAKSAKRGRQGSGEQQGHVGKTRVSTKTHARTSAKAYAPGQRAKTHWRRRARRPTRPASA